MSELDYRSGFSNESGFHESSIQVNNNAFTAQAASNTTATFIIPFDVYNWSKSHLDFDVRFANPDGVTTISALHMGKNMFIQSINLLYKGGGSVAVVDINEARPVSAATTIPQLQLGEFNTRPVAMQGVDATVNTLERFEVLQPIKHSSIMQYNAAGAVSAVVGNTYSDLGGMGGYSVEIDTTANGATTAPSVCPGDTSVCTAIGNASAQLSTNFKIRINFSDYKNTLFALNKTIAYTADATLKIVFAPYQQWGFTITGTGSTVSLAGSANLTPSAAAIPLIVSNLNLFMAVEHNPKIRSACEMVSQAGFNMRMPYISVQGSIPLVVSAGGVKYSFDINNSIGDKLLRIYTVVMRNSDIGVGFMSNANTVNLNGGGYPNNLYSSIRTYLNGTPRQISALSCALGEDYRFLREVLKGSTVTSQTGFQNFAFFVDDFVGSRPSCEWDEHNTDVSGLPTDRSITYTAEIATNRAASQCFFIAVGQRDLIISSRSVST